MARAGKNIVRFNMPELPPDVYEKIQKLSAEGDALADEGAYEQALSQYNKAWELVPDPKNEWEASTWLLAAIGDACFLGGFYSSGSEALHYAVHCPGGLGNPFIHLRLGQCEYECNNHSIAADQLARAYMIEGKNIFASEDKKYFEFLKTKIAPPASGVW